MGPAPTRALAHRPLLPRKVSSPARRCPTGVPPWVEPAGCELGRNRTLVQVHVPLNVMTVPVPASAAHPCARHRTLALRCRADAVKGWSAARDPIGGAAGIRAIRFPSESHRRSTWNLGRPIAQGPEGAADLGSTGRTTQSEQVMNRWVLHQLSRRVRCVLTPWPARAGMLDREGRFEAPIRAELPRLRDGQRF